MFRIRSRKCYLLVELPVLGERLVSLESRLTVIILIIKIVQEFGIVCVLF